MHPATRFLRSWISSPVDEPPIRAELFSAEQMKQHGRVLARAHETALAPTPDRLLARLADNEAVLVATRDQLTASVKQGRRIAPAGEWLLDNYYLIEEQIGTARRHLPKGYSRELPSLHSGPSAGFPRVYDIALETIAHSDARVDAENLSNFVAAYQSATVLTLGELWAIPIMLRLALLENLRRVAAGVSSDRTDRDRANHWADLMLEAAETDPNGVILVVADLARSGLPLRRSFVAEFARRLRGQSPALAIPLHWIEQRLAATGQTVEQMVQAENQQQAADQVSIGNSIRSLRFLSAMDWREFVETMSAVESALREEPAQVYPGMDFTTRDRYRHVVERVADDSGRSEVEVARLAVQLAAERLAEDPGNARRSHVGHYLVDRGRLELEARAGVRLRGLEPLRRAAARHTLFCYLAAIWTVATTAATAAVLAARPAGLPDWGLLLLGLATALAASQLGVSTVNWLVSLGARPHFLPRLDLSAGLPSDLRTLVVVPTMLTSGPGVQELVDALEMRFLANRDPFLHFGLLTDFADANAQHTPADEPLISLARERIEELNRKYASQDAAFFLFHRGRRWNRRERTWMGRERKRGKLAELNSLLRGSAIDGFAVLTGDTSVLAHVKYVITLDTDTQLPRDTARQLVGTMAHPLNRPRWDAARQRVIEGYGILQPRVAVALPGASRSRYAQLWGGEAGLDPYTRAVSDTYQDLFGEGSFIGKGIYDVDVFQQALEGRLPDNRILSHDLLEGCHARSGLVSDVQLYEDYPDRYAADVSRRHRWIRGDWQLFAWILPRVPGVDGKSRRNPLSSLSIWKLFDNLRRSLVPATLTLLLIAAWTMLSPAGTWTLALLGVLAIPPLLATLQELWQLATARDPGLPLGSALPSAGRRLAQLAFTVACLPHEAWYSLDAVLRTLARLVLGGSLLEWTPSSDEARRSHGDLRSAWRTMWIGPALGLAVAILLAALRPAALASAGLVLALWIASPVLAWWMSCPLPSRRAALSEAQLVFLRKLARKTWGYFETYAGAEDNWLPPDNVQDLGRVQVAHRTSPTNIGLALLSNLAAHDFGYLSFSELLDRTTRTFDTMEALERHLGHFYNWYDTRTLAPLPPRYVSTVDSGNLSGHLLTLRQGLLAIAQEPYAPARTLAGLLDAIRVLRDSADDGYGAAWAPLGELEKVALAELSSGSAASAARVGAFLDRLDAILADIARPAGARDASSGETAFWVASLRRQARGAREQLGALVPSADDPQASTWSNAERAAAADLAARCAALADVEYEFLFDRGRQLLAIGYNVSERRRDTNFYDLLASEARLSTFLGISQERLPQDAWFALGRSLGTVNGNPVLLSWSGSMFEYLMPLLVMPTYAQTLLDQTYRAAVAGQIAYGRQRGVPWGMSESAYNTVDAQLNYQYRAFGVPGLGLKRGLAADLVVAPYASALALMVQPEEACENLQRLAEEGVEGRFGLYEAIDYTPSRLPRGSSRVVIRSFMAHHQGMSLLALNHLLLDRPMHARFEADPAFRATLLLLHERVPRSASFHRPLAELSAIPVANGAAEAAVRTHRTASTPTPQVQLLSNGRYHVMLTNSGGGYSRWRDLALTRWREDPTRDHWGNFCYLRDVATGAYWSAGHQPTLRSATSYEVTFSDARVDFHRRDRDFDSHLAIAVSPEDDVEVRRLHLTNRSRETRQIEVTSYAEVVLSPPAAEALHPAFSNLFVETEIVAEEQAILCHRRPRSRKEPAPWMFHLMAVHGGTPEPASYETDRQRFIGRGRSAAEPAALTESGALSGTQGCVLDPIVAIRQRITLEPESSITVNIVTGAGDSREFVTGLVAKYRDRRLAHRVFDLAWTHSAVMLRQLNASEADAQLYGRLAGAVIHAGAALRAEPSVLLRNHRGQSGLWGYSISGDLPIVLLRIADPANLEMARQLIQAHTYWRLKGLAVDLVIWNEDHAGYRQILQEQISGLIAASVDAATSDRPGGIFVRPADQISEEDRVLLQAVARVILSDTRGSLADQLKARAPEDAEPLLVPARTTRPPDTAAELPREDLLFANGIGGFSRDGREYVITTARGRSTPAPWVNVLANPQFGSVVSEAGASFTWSENAQEFRLSPWMNDSVSDFGGEAFYLRDEETGRYWSPTPAPTPGVGGYVCRHGFGSTLFQHLDGGIHSEFRQSVATDASVKILVLTLRNQSGRARRLSATGYVEWVLGDQRPKTSMHVLTELDAKSGALFARNAYNTEFAGRVAFFHADDASRSHSCDRREFLGRNGTPRNPEAMTRTRLSGRSGAALDPCAAIQVPIRLADGEQREIVFLLGVGRDADEARQLVERFGSAGGARAALDAVAEHWERILGTVRVETPDPALDLLANGWLLYQTLACRFWARTAHYQPGGAFGFRDQLQDSMALLHAAPELTRAQILRSASRQFPEGDVQHWWHPPSGRGVRTHCSDDYLWLPFAVARYLAATGDAAILDETVGFVDGRPVKPDEDSYYDLPHRTEEAASLYGHCVRALLHGMRRGEHGLPLMGTGDWNDGMNLVGALGKGESVWLGFFLHRVLAAFAELSRSRGDGAFADRCLEEMKSLRRALEEHAWDGAWYRRAYFDDGTPLGSAENPECQIDSIAQSWSVLSGAGDATRSRQAMDSLDRRLVRRAERLVQLLDPPFAEAPLDPGYIAGYPPGVRENGGQYTHAAIWAGMAFAARGDRRRAWELMNLLNPIRHGESPEGVAVYRVEPYVVAADVYAVPPHTGRGGWTWYTGSAGWMYQWIIDSLLGIHREGDRLRFAPCLPSEWPGCRITYRHGQTVYEIAVTQTTADRSQVLASLDGATPVEDTIPLVDDGKVHRVDVRVSITSASPHTPSESAARSG